jgi:hypothetical protein
MTAQEQQMLQGLVERINHTQLAEKDPDAEQFIQQNLGPNPDSLYILAQTVLVQGYALEQAQKQLSDLRAQLEQARQVAPEPKHATSFLGSLLGHHDESQRQAPPPPPPPQMPMPTQYGGAPMYAPSGGYPLPGQPQGGGFLRSAMQTATGVAAGALAFEGIESLMHGFGHEAGYGPGFGGGGFEGGGRPEEVINNYYGDSGPHEHGGDAASGRDDRSSGFYDPSSDASRSDASDSGKAHDAAGSSSDSGGTTTNADDLSGTAGTDYSSDGDDSMLSDDVGDQGGDDSGGDDSGGDFDSGGDDSGSGDGGF